MNVMQRFRAGDGAEITFFESGTGSPALVFVHGWQGDHTVWQPIIETLGDDFHTVAVDLRGSGASHNAGGPYDLERFAADLRGIIEARGPGPAVVIGHSMGGTIALRLAVDSPELTRGLVLVAPVPASGGGYSEKGAAYLRSTAGDTAMARKWLERTFYHPPASTVLDQLCAAAAATDRDVALESFASWAHADFAEATRAIKAPVLLLAPQHDIPDVYERKVAALLSNAQFTQVPACAHYAVLEKPQVIAAAIREFVGAGG